MGADPMELEYFDLNGRALQLRAAAWYCSVNVTNKRTSFAEFRDNKNQGKYKFGTLPVVNLKDGTQLA